MNDYKPNVALFGMLLVGVGLSGMCGGTAEAEEWSTETPVPHNVTTPLSDEEIAIREARRVFDEAHLNLAKMCVNEAGWENPHDCNAIWQAVMTHVGRGNVTSLDIIAAQNRLSPRLTGAREWGESGPRGNARWSLGLTLSDAQPEGWEGVYPDHPWELYSERRWPNILEWARRLVDGAVEHNQRGPRQCNGSPVTWGGTMGSARKDRELMALRNAARVRAGQRPYEILHCGDTINRFWGHPTRSNRSGLMWSVEIQ